MGGESKKRLRRSMFTTQLCIQSVSVRAKFWLHLQLQQENVICPSTDTHTHTHIPLKQTFVARLTNWAHFFTRKIFIEQSGLSLHLLLFLIERFPPLFLSQWVDCLQPKVSGILSLGIGRHWLGWCLIAQHHSQSQCLLQCNSCAFGRHPYWNREHFSWLFRLFLITRWLASEGWWTISLSFWEELVGPGL